MCRFAPPRGRSAVSEATACSERESERREDTRPAECGRIMRIDTVEGVVRTGRPALRSRSALQAWRRLRPAQRPAGAW